MISALAGFGDVGRGLLERRVESRAMLGNLAPRPLALAQEIEQRRGILPLEALLHVLRGDDRVVVLGDDPARHRAHLAERPGAPRAKDTERQHESRVAQQELGPQFHRGSPFGRLVVGITLILDRDNLHRRVADIAQETIDDRPVNEQVPPRSGGLPEDDVRDALALRELDQPVGHSRP